MALGSLASLKRSIDKRGLLHPIVLRNGSELVSGARRLESCRQLGWDTIPARRVENMPDDELRAIEVDENEQRLGLADYESSKQRLAEIRQAEADILVLGTKKKRGRPSKGKASRREVTKKTGVTAKVQRNVERHVEIAEAFPFMQKAGWKQYTVLEAGEAIAAIPKREHSSLAVLLDQPGVPPKTAIRLIRNVAAMEKPVRLDIYDRAKSADPEVRSAAMTDAAKLPREPHACLLAALTARRDICKCSRHEEFLAAIDAFISKLKEEKNDVT